VPKTDDYDFEYAPLLIVVSGPAGVGKDSLVKRLQERTDRFYFVVTVTDRTPRPGETEGVDYFFVKPEEFLRMERENQLLEHALVYGQHKGITKRQVRQALESGKDVIMRLDVQGASTIRQLAPGAITIFLSAPSEAVLERRLRDRGNDSFAQVEKRIREARAEMKALQTFDYIVVNHNGALDAAVDQVLSIVTAEHCRVQPRRVTL